MKYYKSTSTHEIYLYTKFEVDPRGENCKSAENAPSRVFDYADYEYDDNCNVACRIGVVYDMATKCGLVWQPITKRIGIAKISFITEIHFRQVTIKVSFQKHHL